VADGGAVRPDQKLTFDRAQRQGGFAGFAGDETGRDLARSLGAIVGRERRRIRILEIPLYPHLVAVGHGEDEVGAILGELRVGQGNTVGHGDRSARRHFWRGDVDQHDCSPRPRISTVKFYRARGERAQKSGRRPENAVAVAKRFRAMSLNSIKYISFLENRPTGREREQD
jgi:hypothetical protein